MSDTAYPSVNDPTLEEKVSSPPAATPGTCRVWKPKAFPAHMITDGPHGLRKSLASSTGETDLNDSEPATCFPPAAGLSSSWNPELIHGWAKPWARNASNIEGGRHPGPRRQHQAQPARRPLLRIRSEDHIWPAMRP